MQKIAAREEKQCVLTAGRTITGKFVLAKRTQSRKQLPQKLLRSARSASRLLISHICKLRRVGSRTRLILDAGKQSSFISTNLVDQLELNVIGHWYLAVKAFESSSAMHATRRLINVSA
jgi:hypothetical protein